MSKMKRVFSLVLALVMVLGSFGGAFAQTEVNVATEELKTVPADVIGTEYEKAVSRLVAFDVLNGYEDGTYRPAKDVTRAEFAKILVEALGIGNAADAAVGRVAFPDVPASHWASGYVHVAAGQGLIEGYPNGTFQPNAQVSYAESLTMLVRALGYQDSFLKGTWPGSHIAKAAEAGITAGVNYSDARGGANRGNVAQMVNNALDADVVKVDTYSDGRVEYTETKISLLKDKLNVSKYEDARVIADKIVDDGLETDELTVKFLKEIRKDDLSVKNSYDEGEEKDFRFVRNVNPRKNIGEEVSVYVNDDNRVVYIESEDDDKAQFDYVQEIDKSKAEVSLVKLDKDYKFETKRGSEAIVYVHDEDDSYVLFKGELSDSDLEKLLGKPGKFVVKNNRIVYAEVMSAQEATPWMLVTKNTDGLLVGINQTTEDFDIDLSKTSNYDGSFVFDTNGNALDVKDIEEGNIVYIEKLDYDGDDYVKVVVVQDNVIEGKLSRVKADRVALDGKEYKAVKFEDNGREFQAYYSLEGFEDIQEWNGTEYDDDMEDADGETMYAYLDAAGRIAFLSTEAKGTSGFKYGVVTRTYADNDRIKIYTHTGENDGDEITYTVEKERDLSAPFKLDALGNDRNANDVKYGRRTSEIKNGEVVKFKLNNDGEIADEEFYVMDSANQWKMRTGSDFGKTSLSSTLVSDGTPNSFAVDNRAIIVDAEGLEPGTDNFDVDDFGIAKWEDMAEDNYNPDLRYFVFTKRNNNIDVDALVFVGPEGANTASDEVAIYVIDKYRKAGDDYVEYVTYGSSKVEEREVDKVNDGVLADETPYIARLKSDGTIELFAKKQGDFDYKTGVVKTKSNNVITLEGSNEEYKLAGSAIVYEEDVKKSTSNISVGDAVKFVAENNVDIRVIERLVGNEAKVVKGETTPGTPVADGTVTYIVTDYNDTFGRLTLENRTGEGVTMFVEDFDGYVIGEDEVSEAAMTAWLAENHGDLETIEVTEDNVLVVEGTLTAIDVDEDTVAVFDETQLQTALDDAVKENILVYPGDYGTEAIEIIQKPGVSITLEAVGEVVLKNQIIIDGDARAAGTETLTIKGFTFDFTDATGVVYIISTTNDDILTGKSLNYSHNVTIEDNIFNGTFDATVVAIRSQSSYNLKIIGCRGEGLHSLGQIRSIPGADELEVRDCVVTVSEGGINYTGAGNVTIEALTVVGDLYGVRAGAAGETIYSNSELEISGSDLEAQYPVIIRGATETVTITESTLTPIDDGEMINKVTSETVNITIDGETY